LEQKSLKQVSSITIQLEIKVKNSPLTITSLAAISMEL
jgi:hypothetical protein